MIFNENTYIENAETIDNVVDRIRNFEYKRYQAAPGIRVSKKAFGIGRRYPIINKYNKLIFYYPICIRSYISLSYQGIRFQ